MKYLVVWKDKSKLPYDFRTGEYAKEFVNRNINNIDKVYCYYKRIKQENMRRYVSTDYYTVFTPEEFIKASKIRLLKEQSNLLVFDMKKDVIEGEKIGNVSLPTSIYAYLGKYVCVRVCSGIEYTGWFVKHKIESSKFLVLMNDGKVSDKFGTFEIDSIDLVGEK